MSEVPGSAIITAIAIIVTALIIGSIAAITQVTSSAQNKVINQRDKTIETEWAEMYTKYDGAEVTGAEIMDIIKKNQNITNPIPVLVTINGSQYEFQYSSGSTSADIITKAKQVIDDETLYTGSIEVSEGNTISGLIFTQK